MTSLTVHTSCEYFTGDGKWREADYNARVVVKCVKGDDFKGYWDYYDDGKRVRLDKDNMDAGLDLAGKIIASRLVELINGPVTLVPIPNSNAHVGNKYEFRTLRLAQIIAQHSNGMATASALFYWSKPKAKQHQSSGYRYASSHVQNLRLISLPSSPVVLIDDVVTSGSQMLACAHILRKYKAEVPFGMAVGRASPIQTEKALIWSENVVSQIVVG